MIELLMWFGVGALAMGGGYGVYGFFTATAEEKKTILKFTWKCLKVVLLLCFILFLIGCCRYLLSSGLPLPQ